jgi:hypothetical protein
VNYAEIHNEFGSSLETNVGLALEAGPIESRATYREKEQAKSDEPPDHRETPL